MTDQPGRHRAQARALLADWRDWVMADRYPTKPLGPAPQEELAERIAAALAAAEAPPAEERQAWRIREGQYREGAAALLDECAQLRDAIARWKQDEAIWKEIEAGLLKRAEAAEAPHAEERKGVELLQRGLTLANEMREAAEADNARLRAALAQAEAALKAQP